MSGALSGPVQEARPLQKQTRLLMTFSGPQTSCRCGTSSAGPLMCSATPLGTELHNNACTELPQETPLSDPV